MPCKPHKFEIVQLHSVKTRNPMFAGCLMVITDPKEWGAMGYVQALGRNGKPGGQAYYRALCSEMARTHGVADFIIGDEEDA